MMDREARDRAADVVEHFVAGRTGSDALDHALGDVAAHADRGDPALQAIRECLWAHYCDLTDQRIDELPEEAREVFRRSAVFLRSEREYGWPAARGLAVPTLPWIGVLLASVGLVALALHGWLGRAAGPRVETGVALVGLAGFLAVWAWLWLGRWRLRKLMEQAGDRLAFPFLSQEEHAQEAARQGLRRDAGIE